MPIEFKRPSSRSSPRMPDIDRRILDAVAALPDAPESVDQYVTPALLASQTGATMQRVGMCVGQMLGVKKIRDKGYSTQALIDGYRAWQERNHDHAG